MIQLWAWEFEGKTDYGFDSGACVRALAWRGTRTGYRVSKSQVTDLRKVKVVDEDAVTISKELWGWINSSDVAYESGWRIVERISLENPQLNTTPPVTKTYLTTEQFIKVWQSLDESKQEEVSAANSAANSAAISTAWYAAWDAARNAAWDAAWYAAWDADLAIVVRDKITPDQFNILVQPWTSCGLSLYAEDWDEVLNPPVAEPKNFGAIVEAWDYDPITNKREKAHFFNNGGDWILRNTLYNFDWSDLINPTIISEGVE